MENLIFPWQSNSPPLFNFVTLCSLDPASCFHLRETEKSSDSFIPFSWGSCWAVQVLPKQPPGPVQPECSSGLHHSLLRGSEEQALPFNGHMNCFASCPCSVLTPLLMSLSKAEQDCVGKITGKKMLAFQPQE